MNTLPNLPSDSVYKFFAILGVVCLIFSLTYTDSQTESFAARFAQAEKDFRVAGVRLSAKQKQLLEQAENNWKKIGEIAPVGKEAAARVEQLFSDLERVERDVAQTAHRKIVTLTEKQRAALEEIRDQNREQLKTLGTVEQGAKEANRALIEMRGSLNTLDEEVRVSTIESEYLAEQEAELRGRYELWRITENAGYLFGFALTFIGFRLWWTRVQVFQDMILRKQARETGMRMPRRGNVPAPVIQRYWKQRWRAFRRLFSGK